MDDRELLELAAKAAGIEVFTGRFGSKHALLIDAGLNGYVPWNPLTDDGDALRLAVELGMLVNVCIEASPHNQSYAVTDGRQAMVEAHNRDKFSATRRAIVRAAAEIGKGIK
jgi:hypothetical protein